MDHSLESLRPVDGGEIKSQEMVRGPDNFEYRGPLGNFLPFQNRQEKLGGSEKRFQRNPKLIFGLKQKNLEASHSGLVHRS